MEHRAAPGCDLERVRDASAGGHIHASSHIYA
jgi:hypothetical protein